MAVCCDLEIDVNGEETFMVDKVKEFFLFYFSFLCELCLFRALKFLFFVYFGKSFPSNYPV